MGKILSMSLKLEFYSKYFGLLWLKVQPRMLGKCPMPHSATKPLGVERSNIIGKKLQQLKIEKTNRVQKADYAFAKCKDIMKV